MTTQQLDNLTPGPETDHDVAEACDIDVVDYGTGPILEEFPWNPSTDWTDAMLAAQLFGLFDNTGHRRQLWRSHNDGEPTMWHITPFESEPNRDTWAASAPTGPLAICRAILKLHHQTQT